MTMWVRLTEQNCGEAIRVRPETGSGKFIDGFEDGLIGAKKGETRTLDLTFPEDYTQDLAGKAVEFTVTVNAVKEPLTEPTDQWVADNIEGYDNVADYKAGIRSDQEENNERQQKTRCVILHGHRW